MSWHYSRALVEASLAATCLDGGACAPSNSTTTHEAYLWLDRTTGVCRRSRYGMTCEPLTDALGADVLTWCLADSLVRTSAVPARVPESPANDPDYGTKWRASSVRFDRDSCGWKTVQCLYGAALPWSLVTLPRWGSMHGGELWEHITLAPRTSGTAYGSWPTPTASMMPCEGTQRLMRKKWLAGELSLEEASAIAGRDVRQAQGKVPMWPTPKASAAGPDFAAVNRGKAISLQTAVAMFPTPTVQDASNNGAPSQHRRNAKPLNAVAGGALNPTWVEWLMGWPLGWTDCGASATDRFRAWCASHGRS